VYGGLPWKTCFGFLFGMCECVTVYLWYVCVCEFLLFWGVVWFLVSCFWVVGPQGFEPWTNRFLSGVYELRLFVEFCRSTRFLGSFLFSSELRALFLVW
jgi:hypothetical protein